jgi:hypothetical protein
LVVFFAGRRPSVEFIRDRFKPTMEPNGIIFNHCYMENSCVIIRFDLEEDLVRVWVNGHISFGRTCMILTKWQPMMDL